jgi:hypothetical protein
MSSETLNQAIDPKVIARIQKFLNLAKDGGATEAEAATAAEMAQKTMRKYNLTMAEVEASGGAGSEGSKRTKQAQKGKAQYEFQQQLMLACAEVNFCVVLVQKEWKRGRMMATGFHLIGREANVIATQHLFDYLNTTTERLAFEFVGSDNRQRLSRTAVSFKEGCALRLAQRLRDRHQQALREQAREARERNAAAQHPASTGTALVLVLTDVAQDEEDRNNDLRWNQPEGTTARKRLENSLSSKVGGAVSDALRAAPTTDKDLLAELARTTAVAVGLPLGLDETKCASEAKWALRAHLDMLKREAELAKETPKQREAREAKEARANERWWRSQERKEQERDSRKDWSAYREGSRAGASVGLDKQVNEGGPGAKRIG